MATVTGHRPPPPPPVTVPDASDPRDPGQHVNRSNLIKVNCDNVFYDKSQSFKIAVMNTQSCRNVSNQIRDIIEEKQIDVFCITESWLKANGDEARMNAMCPDTHDLVSFPRIDRGGGGIAFVYRKSLGNPTCSNFSYTSCEAAIFSFSHNVRLYCPLISFAFIGHHLTM